MSKLREQKFDAWWENARQSWTAIEGDLAKDVAKSAYAEGQADAAERVRRETLEEAAQCAESWKIKFRHEPEQCDPCKMGDLMAGELRALAQKGRAAAVTARQLSEEQFAAIKRYVDYYGAIHFYGCPGDDTCDCSFKPVNDALNSLLREGK